MSDRTTRFGWLALTACVTMVSMAFLAGCRDNRSDVAPSGAEQSGKNASDAGQTPAADPAPVVVMETSLGKIVIQLDAAKAPISARNFLQYADDGFYNGTIFHRVIPGFMIQGGGFTSEMVEKPTRERIKNEADNGLSNARGTIAMARTDVVDSATAQFFINVNNNVPLDHRGPGAEFGYAVFGKVIEGMDVADKIVGVPTTTIGQYADVPAQPVVIQKVYRKTN